MKNLLLPILFFFICITNLSFGQSNTLSTTSPFGIFDKVFDRFGDSVSLGDLMIDKRDGVSVKHTGPLCSSGYFDLYFEVGSGMEGNTPIETARRAVVCQVFSDLSQFIQTPNPNVHVNILISNINQYLPGYNATTNPYPASSSNVLGLASSYYVLPAATSLNIGGIADNEIWKTINSGVDSYTNFASPLIVSGSNPNNMGFYHGYMAVNFNNISTNWHLDLSQNTGVGLYDLYSVVLHEVTHALGFASLIDSTGNSKFGPNYPYYSRYDLHLKTASNLPLITNQGACSLYNFGFNSSLNTSILTPSPSICANQIRYIGSINQAAYTPTLFSNGSSLSHLDDFCHLPNSYTSNQYYVMSYANGTGPAFMKRYLKKEERSILCDLGYKVNPFFGNAVNLNYINYQTTTCQGLGVVGVNDGIDSNGYIQFIANLNSLSPPFTGIVDNDLNTNHFECLEFVYGSGNVISNGTTFQINSNTPGINLLRYIPVSNNNVRGNITYVYVYVKSNNCTPNVCNYINNGDFELTSACGQMGFTPLNSSDCWMPFSNSPDLFLRNCTGQSFGWNTLFNVPATFANTTPVESWNGAPNNSFIGIGSTSSHFNESFQTTLNSPLIPGQTYTIKLKVRCANHYSSPYLTPGGTGKLTVAGTTNLVAPYNIAEFDIPNILTQLTNFNITNNNNWEDFIYTFQYSGATNLNYLVLYNSTNADNSSNQPGVYFYIDDVELFESPPNMNLTLPSILCLNQSITDLTLYAPNSNGVFSGAGVTLNGNTYSFNPINAGVGIHTITYTYINNLNCTITLTDEIEVINTNFSVNASASNTLVCPGQSVTLSASSTSQSTYSWNPGNLSGPTVNSIVNANTTFTLSATSAEGCIATTTIPINVLQTPVIQISPSNPTICSGQQISLSATGALNYYWSPSSGLSSMGGSNVFASPLTNTTYNVTGVDGNGCSSNTSVNLIVNQCNDCNSGTLLSGNIATSPSTGATLKIANNISIIGNVTLNSNNVKIMPNVTITVKPNATLTINGSHLYGCENMWQGIVVEEGGKVILQPFSISNVIQKTTLIEDAIIAIEFQPILNQQNSFVFISDNATFNKNKTAIKINSYSFNNPSSVFLIKNTLFTTRNLYNVSTSTWPLTATIKSLNNNPNPLLSPYITSIYPTSFLKSPNTNIKSQIGLDLIQVGSTILTSPITYHTFTIGSLTQSEYNLFDNLNVSINSLNSNIKVQNSIFQFTEPILNSLTNNALQNIISPTQGTGIACKSNSNIYNKVDVAGLSNLPNQFYGLSIATFVDNLKEVSFNYNNVRSNFPDFQNTPNNIVGYRGVYIRETGQFQSLQVNFNTFYSIRRGISLISNVAGFAPNMSFSNNLFQFKPGITSSNLASDHAILLENSNSTNQMAGGLLYVNNNNIYNVKTGIKATSWRRINLQINSNNISFRESGINIENCIQGTTSNQINLNTVSGYLNFGTDENYRAIVIKSSIGNIISCNSVSNSYSGIYFHSNCNPSKTSRNSMTNHKYGFVLDNNGIIGVQGSLTNPADNLWLNTTWDPTGTTNGEFKTACLNGSNSINSKMYIRNLSGIYSPNGSTISTNGIFQYNYGAPQSILLAQNAQAPTTCSTISNPPVSALTTADIIDALETIASQINDTTFSYDQEKILIDEIFRALESDTTLLQNSFSLNSFYDIIKVSKTGVLYDVEQSLANDSIQNAQLLNSSVIPDNQVEESYKKYYEIYLNFMNDNLTQQDSLTLTNLAQGCPTIQGSAVYLSEALFNFIFIQDTIFIQSCPEYLEKSSFDDLTNDPFEQFQIYPVPNNGHFIVRGPLKKGQKLEVISLDNKILHSYELMENTDAFQIKVELCSGVYYIILKDDSNTHIFRRKFIIVK
jgi:hypothetical protein